MAKYRVVERSYINSSIAEADAIIEFEGTPSTNLEPVDAPAVAATEAAVGADAQALILQHAAAAGADLTNPAEVANVQTAQAAEAQAAAEAATAAAAAQTAAAATQAAQAATATANALV